MIDDILFVVTFLSALGSGIIGGVYFAFSAIIMRALSRLPTHQGVAAMQAINETARNPLYLVAYFGSAAGCLTLVLFSYLLWREPSATYQLLGGAFYLIGSTGVTMAFNAPRDYGLSKFKMEADDLDARWERYVREWTYWNHVRTVASFAAAGCFTLALWA